MSGREEKAESRIEAMFKTCLIHAEKSEVGRTPRKSVRNSQEKRKG